MLLSLEFPLMEVAPTVQELDLVLKESEESVPSTHPTITKRELIYENK